jgi:acyl transferase domain-containing protein
MIMGIERDDTSVTKRALKALQEAEQEIRRLRGAREPIAIVGVACRFPGGATSVEHFWDLLDAGVDTSGPMPPSRRALHDCDDSAVAGVLDAIDGFDAAYFGITAREADAIDPCQRLVLELSVEALESAGVSAGARPRGGIFVGVCGMSGYDLLGEVRAHSAAGVSPSVITGRVAHFFDLRGPCVTVDTACSSSLIAVHLACQSLRSHEADFVLAGGVNIILGSGSTEAMRSTGALAPDGRCKTFDASANGYGRSEGCAMIVLKRLSDAVRDGDRIFATIEGSASGQDGHSNGLTAPNGHSQEQVLRAALVAANLRPDDVGYLEAHGTGTQLGDPIEIEALAGVFARGRSRERPLVLGSVKTNIGHTEGAAGMAGLIKVLGMFERDRIFRHLNVTSPNPKVDWSKLPFAIATEPTAWPRGETRRIAGVSSFGFGGTLAHVVLAEPPSAPALPPELERPRVLTLSAKTDVALAETARVWATFLAATTAPAEAIACTANVRREHHEHRLAVVGANVQEWAAALESGGIRGKVPALRPRIAFVFSGQGPQWWAMGRELLANNATFRGALTTIQEAIRAAGGPLVLDELHRSEAESRVSQTAVAQPVLFALQTGLVAVLKEWGIEPDLVVGHSLGEIAAAHAVGALTLDEAARVVVRRGALMQRATGAGRMASVALTADEAHELVAGHEGRLSVAATNGPRTTVLSGDPDPLEAELAALSERGVAVKRLAVDYAFHSHQMKPFGRELVAELEGLSPRSGRRPIVSTVTAQVEPGTSFDAAYWGRQLFEPVRFARSIEELEARGCELFVEIGPHPVLVGDIVDTLVAKGREARALPTLRRRAPEQRQLLETLAELHCAGVPVDWSKHHTKPVRVAALPAYAWQHERYWADGPVRSRATKAPEVSPPKSLQTIRTIVTPEPGIAPDAPLAAVGVDSLTFVDLRRLLGALPGGREVARKLRLTSPVSDVLVFLDSVEGTNAPSADAALDFAPIERSLRDAVWSAVLPATVNKRSADNVLLQRCTRTDAGAIAELRMFPEHPFFYERPLDHVPGLYLIESARQLGNWVLHAEAGRLEAGGTLDHVEADFLEFVEHDEPAWLVAEGGAGTMTTRLFQSGKLKATFVVSGRRIDAIEYSRLRGEQREFSR